MAPLYDILTTAASAVAIPALWLRSAAGAPGGRRVFAERLGRLPRWPEGKGIWLQAVSVGEVRVARTFLEGLRLACPSLPVALSTTTASGGEAARGAGADLVFSFPLDAPWIIRRALGTLSPAAFGTVETEIWPVLLKTCASRSIPAFVASGTISERSAKRWMWMAGAVREGLAALRAACMQTQDDAERLVRLGAPARSVEVTGNIKFDARAPSGAESMARLGRLLSLPPGSPVLVAGSTSEGEEMLVVESWREARKALPSLVLIVAPRHPARFDAVGRALEAAGIPFLRRSSVQAEAASAGRSVILLDSMGELESAYGLGQVAFVGGSLVPRGGQNPLEPVRLGLPVLFGPGMDSFREVADELMESGAAFEVRGAGDLAREVLRLMTDPAAHRSASQAGLRFAEGHRGATERTVQALRRRIPEVFR